MGQKVRRRRWISRVRSPPKGVGLPGPRAQDLPGCDATTTRPAKAEPARRCGISMLVELELLGHAIIVGLLLLVLLTACTRLDVLVR